MSEAKTMGNKGSYLAVKAGKTVSSYLDVGDYLSSPDKLFHAIMQEDGILSVCRGEGPQNKIGESAWSSGSGKGKGQYYVRMQDDGNLVIYEGAAPHGKKGVVWASGSTVGEGQYYVRMQDDGNLIIYKGAAPHENNGVVWASKSMQSVKRVSMPVLTGDGTGSFRIPGEDKRGKISGRVGDRLEIRREGSAGCSIHFGAQEGKWPIAKTEQVHDDGDYLRVDHTSNDPLGIDLMNSGEFEMRVSELGVKLRKRGPGNVGEGATGTLSVKP